MQNVGLVKSYSKCLRARECMEHHPSMFHGGLAIISLIQTRVFFQIHSARSYIHFCQRLFFPRTFYFLQCMLHIFLNDYTLQSVKTTVATNTCYVYGAYQSRSTNENDQIEGVVESTILARPHVFHQYCVVPAWMDMRLWECLWYRYSTLQLRIDEHIAMRLLDVFYIFFIVLICYNYLYFL